MPNHRIDITGQRFGKLVAIKRSERVNAKGEYYWVCKCDCGNYTEANPRNLRHGSVSSCGCVARHIQSERMKKWHKEHPENRRTHGLSSCRLWAVWSDMRVRCRDKKSAGYKHYGARGIKVCDEWDHSFPAFYKWAYENGYDDTAPSGACTLDRIDVNGNYEPSNCRFVDARIQANNKRTNRFLEINGEKRTVADWASYFGMPYATLYHRVFYRGFTPEDAVNMSNNIQQEATR